MNKLNDKSSLQDVYDFLKETPEDKWTRDYRTSWEGNHCALGWIDLAMGIDPNNFYDTQKSVELIRELLPTEHKCGQLDIVDVNNNSENPKAAVLEYLSGFLVKKQAKKKRGKKKTDKHV